MSDLSDKQMCPQCGDLFGGSGLIPIHIDAGGRGYCGGSEQNPRCPESDGRPLWNGKPNPHYYRNAEAKEATVPEPTIIATRTTTLEGSEDLWLNRNDILILAACIELNGGTLSHFMEVVGAMKKGGTTTDILIGGETDA